MAYRMQSSVPELMDLSGESDSTFKLYGEAAKEPGSFAACCLNARRLVERGVRNVQIFHRGWDAHGNLPGEHENQCKDIDQGSAALIKDLKTARNCSTILSSSGEANSGGPPTVRVSLLIKPMDGIITQGVSPHGWQVEV